MSEGLNLQISSPSKGDGCGESGDDKLAQFDIYLIRKLKESEIEQNTIDKYLNKLDLIDEAHSILL
jgi:hypothetical protein